MDIIINAYEYLRPGGIIMIPLIFTSILMWALIIDRVRDFRWMDKNDIDLQEAVQLLKGKPVPYSSTGLRTGVVIDFLNKRTKNKKLDQGILKLCIIKKRSHIRQFLTVITILAAVAPLFGLLGTVTGMMTTFDVISVFGTGNAKAMAGGISEALITTQSGLLVAIPGLFMSGFLLRKAVSMENRLNELIMIMKRNL